MAKRVTFTNKAYDDIDRIIEFNNLRNQSNTYSRKFLTGLKERLLKLYSQPLSGKQTDNPEILVLIWDNFYIYYQPLEKSIEVTAIYHQKENVER